MAQHENKVSQPTASESTQNVKECEMAPVMLPTVKPTLGAKSNALARRVVLKKELRSKKAI